MCVPDFHGCVCVCVCFHWRVDRTEKQDSWRIDSSHQFYNASNHSFQKSWHQTKAITNHKNYSPNIKHDNILTIWQKYFKCTWCIMIHDATHAYSTGKELALFFSLLAPTPHRKNGLPGAGRAFWAAETGRMRLLRQSSSGRRRELPTTQIVTIKPQMKIHWIPFKIPWFCCFVFF